MENRRVRVRFAPSPTGPLHMGGVRTALYNYLFAKKHGGDFILRIEDTDQERFVPGAEEYIIEALKWCGIEPNEGVGFGDGPCAPYKQSVRKEQGVYEEYAKKLIDSGNAYYAFDTKEELDEQRERYEKMKKTFAYNGLTRQELKNSLTLSEDEVNRRIAAGEPYVVRTKIPRNEEVRFNDLIRGWVVVHTSQLDDKVLFKSDGMPTYHLANIVDDYSMKITHVIRGEEWLPSAPLHVLLYRFLGWEDVMPQFSHLPLLLRPDGNGKLSKRDGDRLGFPVFPLSGTLPDVKTGQPEIFTGYRESGYFPEAFINMLALLGWHSSGNQEIFSKEELIQEFSLERVSKSGAKFDAEKTKWFNQQYLRMKTDLELAFEILPQVYQESFLKNTPLSGTRYDLQLRISNPTTEKKTVRLFANESIPEGVIVERSAQISYETFKNTLRSEPSILVALNYHSSSHKQLGNELTLKSPWSEEVFLPVVHSINSKIPVVEFPVNVMLHAQTSFQTVVEPGENIALNFEAFSTHCSRQGGNLHINYLQEVCRLMKEKVTFTSEIIRDGRFFFEAPISYDDTVIKKRWNPSSKLFIEALRDAYAAFDANDDQIKEMIYSPDSGNRVVAAALFEGVFKNTAEATGTNPGSVMQLFRVCVSGAGGGPVLFEMVALLGKDVVVQRLDRAVNSIS